MLGLYLWFLSPQLETLSGQVCHYNNLHNINIMTKGFIFSWSSFVLHAELCLQVLQYTEYTQKSFSVEINVLWTSSSMHILYWINKISVPHIFVFFFEKFHTKVDFNLCSVSMLSHWLTCVRQCVKVRLHSLIKWLKVVNYSVTDKCL